MKSFEDLWSSSILLTEDSIEEYQLDREPFQSGQWMDLFAAEDQNPEEGNEIRVEPNAVQTEALYRLEETRQKGQQRALVQAATGTGKTFLAAFDSRTFERVLFVAHRREILAQAAKAFHTVRPDASIGFIEGDRKELDRDLVFASVQTLAKPWLLNEETLPSDSFDYIVVDEFHHAAARQYKRSFPISIQNFF
ncbi:DEAD/DEAH box helicase family protein [Allobaculum sp. Allo2]|uniref:DEAD/DEAH box helicase family protein n=1 Tax=Allobaculum sp. Allo2 TaxID=2853432 RepID=UPI001F6120F8|nr:DEAD/DEAH box helicase family protein [Allobaculum sp. Allo2]UNT93926.1 DEAD/DEAH box helicase family protein [Allobaculum sp. Allo2]